MSTAQKPLRRIRVSDETHRVTTFELFFDLVFVFAFTQVTGFVGHEHSLLGVLQGLIILGMLWWCWASYSWLANQTHVDEGVVRIGMSVAMIAMFVLALVIPEAFHDLEGGLSGPIVLALAYFVVRLVHIGLYLIAAGEDSALRRQVLRTSTAMFTGSGLILVGSVIGGPFQTWWWLGGLVADIVLTYTTSTGGNWRLHSARHWAERYGLVVILALGESIVAIGVGAAQLPVSWPILAASILGVGLSVMLWWLYFDWMSGTAEKVLIKAQGMERTALATDAYTYLHLAVIAGVIFSALGVEQVLTNLDGGPFGWFGAAALYGGTALYLAGLCFFWRRVSGSWNTWRLGFTALILVAMPLGALVPPVAALAVLVLLAVALVAVESRTYSGLRREHRLGHDAPDPAGR